MICWVTILNKNLWQLSGHFDLAVKNGKMYALAVGSARKNPIADLSAESLSKVQGLINGMP